jgi:hypothetical protein
VVLWSVVLRRMVLRRMMLRRMMLRRMMLRRMMFGSMMLRSVVLGAMLFGMMLGPMVFCTLVYRPVMLFSMMLLTVVFAFMSRLAHRRFFRVPLILGEFLIVIVDSIMFMRALAFSHVMMPLAIRSFFFGCGFPIDTTRTVEAGTVMLFRPSGPVRVGVVNVATHMPARGVIEKVAAVPMAAPKTGPEITKPIVDPSVESDERPPITDVPEVGSSVEAPPARRPKKPYFRWFDPNTGDPVIVVVPIGPVARDPKVSIRRARGLIVNGNRRRRDSNRHIRGGKAWGKGQQTCEEYQMHSFRNELQHKIGCNFIRRRARFSGPKAGSKNDGIVKKIDNQADHRVSGVLGVWGRPDKLILRY